MPNKNNKTYKNIPSNLEFDQDIFHSIEDDTTEEIIPTNIPNSIPDHYIDTIED